MSILEFRNVSFTYPTSEALILKNLNFHLEEGELTAVIGPSGCGKTTLLKLVNRLLEPSQGEIFYQNEGLTSQAAEKLRRRMGYVIQNVGLFPHWTVAENIAAVPKLLGWPKAKIETRVDELLNLVGLNPQNYRGSKPASLSGGQAQRVGIARALAADPPLLLMDEPFGALDPLQRARLQAALQDLQARIKKTILFITHDLDEAILLADRVLVMNHGEILQNDSPENLLAKPKGSFVRDFVGADRGLRQLIRRKVAEVFSPVTGFTKQAELPTTNDGDLWPWIVDKAGKPLGWLKADLWKNGSSWEEAFFALPEDLVLLSPRSSLKEALSLMLGSGLKTLPVVDNQGVLLGELSLKTLEQAGAEAKGARLLP